MQPKPLTKSRFVMGVECPQKLVFSQDKRYRNLKREDSFLASLADGGFQVGEFAKAHFPGGQDVVSLDRAEAIKETEELLSAENVVIFEAAICFENCFVRIDVLEKKSNRFVIHEVKAKSFNSKEDRPFLTKKGTISSSWRSYIYDVAFQKFVLSHAFPDSSVTANLMLVDKAATSPVDGLHQCFKVVDDGGRRSAAQVAAVPVGAVNAGLLKSVPVDYECDLLYQATQHGTHFLGSFSTLVNELSEVCEGVSSPKFSIYSGCGGCEFRSLGAGDHLRSGFEDCIRSKGGIEVEASDQLIFDLWNNRDKDDQLASGAIRLTDLTEEDLGYPDAPSSGSPLTTQQRQWLQISKERSQSERPYVDVLGLSQEMATWEFPLHFIDFETTRTALPFFSAQGPYHNIAFQFSHHRVLSDGSVEHANQFLLAQADVNPNARFVTALKDALAGDNGTIFMYSAHENSTLGAIHRDLSLEEDPSSAELQAFIESIATPGADFARKWSPSRPMVDLLKIVKGYLYLPSSRGSNSLKAILPSILNASDYLQETYSKPIYGRGRDIPSLNIESKVWVKKDADGQVINPYQHLPDLACDLSTEEREELAGLDKVSDGGAALTAYGRLMYEDLSAATRRRIEQSLLEYCELDTLAMVLLYQGLLDLMDRAPQR